MFHIVPLHHIECVVPNRAVPNCLFKTLGAKIPAAKLSIAKFSCVCRHIFAALKENIQWQCQLMSNAVGQRQLAQCQVSVFYFHRRPWGQPPSHQATGAWWQFAGFFLPGPGSWAVQPALGWLVESTAGPTLTCTHNRLPR